MIHIRGHIKENIYHLKYCSVHQSHYRFRDVMDFPGGIPLVVVENSD